MQINLGLTWPAGRAINKLRRPDWGVVVVPAGGRVTRYRGETSRSGSAEHWWQPVPVAHRRPDEDVQDPDDTRSVAGRQHPLGRPAASADVDVDVKGVSAVLAGIGNVRLLALDDVATNRRRYLGDRERPPAEGHSGDLGHGEQEPGVFECFESVAGRPG